MENGQERYIRIRSYSKAWKVENRIYAIQNIILPFPINPREVLYFLVGILVAFLLGIFIPPVRTLPPVLRFVALPFGITKLLNKKKFDGKNPARYLLGLIRYILDSRNYMERFRKRPIIKAQKIKLDWWCSYVQLPD